MSNVVYFSIITLVTNANKVFILKILKILLELGVGAVNINSLCIGLTVYFIGRRVLI